MNNVKCRSALTADRVYADALTQRSHCTSLHFQSYSCSMCSKCHRKLFLCSIMDSMEPHMSILKRNKKKRLQQFKIFFFFNQDLGHFFIKNFSRKLEQLVWPLQFRSEKHLYVVGMELFFFTGDKKVICLWGYSKQRDLHTTAVVTHCLKLMETTQCW